MRDAQILGGGMLGNCTKAQLRLRATILATKLTTRRRECLEHLGDFMKTSMFRDRGPLIFAASVLNTDWLLSAILGIADATDGRSKLYISLKKYEMDDADDGLREEILERMQSSAYRDIETDIKMISLDLMGAGKWKSLEKLQVDFEIVNARGLETFMGEDLLPVLDHLNTYCGAQIEPLLQHYDWNDGDLMAVVVGGYVDLADLAPREQLGRFIAEIAQMLSESDTYGSYLAPFICRLMKRGQTSNFGVYKYLRRCGRCVEFVRDVVYGDTTVLKQCLEDESFARSACSDVFLNWIATRSDIARMEVILKRVRSLSEGRAARFDPEIAFHLIVREGREVMRLFADTGTKIRVRGGATEANVWAEILEAAAEQQCEGVLDIDYDFNILTKILGDGRYWKVRMDIDNRVADAWELYRYASSLRRMW